MVEQLIPNQQVMGSIPVYPANSIGTGMERIFNYIKLSRLELIKVIFPLKEQVRNAFLSVILVVFVITIFLAVIDLVMSVSLSGFIR